MRASIHVLRIHLRQHKKKPGQNHKTGALQEVDDFGSVRAWILQAVKIIVAEDMC